MLNPISNNIHNLWEQWNVRGIILFSLFLQIYLTLCSSLRKCMQNDLLRFSIWAAYLGADWTANFCVGHIASNQVSDNKSSSRTHSHLLAFWAPFLLVHLGGPDTIAAFSLEDNNLWRRHMLGFIIQFTTCAYVFLLTLPGNSLWLPTLLIFVSGMIKYGERIYALYHASIYIKRETSHLFMVGPSSYYHLSKESSFSKAALEVLESKLNLLYEACFTKFPLMSRNRSLFVFRILRFVGISCVLTAFGLFFFNEDKHKKSGFNDFDVKVTYTLLCGAVALDTIALLMRLFAPFSSIRIQKFIHLKRLRWRKCKKKPFTKYTKLSTWLPFRRWNESISGFNMISYCHSVMATKYYRCMVPSHYRCSTVFMRLHVVKNPFLLELWEFILSDRVSEWQKSRQYKTPNISDGFKGVYRWIEENNILSGLESCEKLSFTLDNEMNTGFGSRLIVWHIVTLVLY